MDGENGALLPQLGLAASYLTVIVTLDSCVSVRARVQMCMEARRGTGCPGVGVIGSFELLGLGAGILTDFVLFWNRPLP